MTKKPGSPSKWTPDGTPFCWLPKESLKRIDEGLELGPAASAKLVLLALCLIASDRNKPSFQVPINLVAKLASLGRRTVERRLPDLEALGLVIIRREKMHASHLYTVAKLSRNDASLSRNDATAMKPVAVALPRELENKRRDGKASPKTSDTETPKPPGYWKQEHDRKVVEENCP